MIQFTSCQTDSEAASGETTVPPIQACYQEVLANDTTLEECNVEFLDVLQCCINIYSVTILRCTIYVFVHVRSC